MRSKNLEKKLKNWNSKNPLGGYTEGGKKNIKLLVGYGQNIGFLGIKKCKKWEKIL